jgi:hypothetical protein
LMDVYVERRTKSRLYCSDRCPLTTDTGNFLPYLRVIHGSWRN